MRSPYPYPYPIPIPIPIPIPLPDPLYFITSYPSEKAIFYFGTGTHSPTIPWWLNNMNMLALMYTLISLWFASFGKAFTWPLLKTQRLTLQLLSDDSHDKIESIRVKYNNLSKQNGDVNNIKELKVIIDSADALISIEKDLLMFQEHLNGDDDKLKETAAIFTREFQDCKKNIEEQLTVLLKGLEV